MSESASKIIESLDERMPLRRPIQLSDKKYKGAAGRSIRTTNQLVGEVFAETTTVLPKLIAQVRMKLGLSRGKFAKAGGMSSNGYKPMEKDLGEGKKPHFIKYTKALNVWRRRGISEGVREQCLDLLSGKNNLYDFYHELGYDLGHENVKKKIPKIFNTLWQRRKSRRLSVPDFNDVLNHVSLLYPEPPAVEASDERYEKAVIGGERRRRRLDQAEGIWTDEKKKQLEERGLEKPLQEFLIALERHFTHEHGTNVTLATLAEHCGFGPKHSAMLTRGELIPWESVEPMVQKLFPEQKWSRLEGQWRFALRKEQKRESFASEYVKAMEACEFSFATVGRLLDVRSPEARGKKGKKNRRQRYRPDAEVRSMVYDNSLSSQVDVDSLIAVVAPNNPKLRTRLTELYALERKRCFHRTGSGLEGEGMEMKIMRERAGVSMKVLAPHFLPANADHKEIRKKNLELQRLERAERKEHAIGFPEVMKILKRIADEKVATSLHRLEHQDEISEDLLQWDSVADMAAKLVKAKKGARNVSQLMREKAPTDAHWLRSDLILAMIMKGYVPPLHALRHMSASVVAKNLPPAVEQDWHDAFPASLRDRQEHPMQDPLARILTTVIARVEAGAAKKFYQDRARQEDPSKASQKLHQLQRYGERPEIEFVEATMLAAGFGRGTIMFKLVQAVHKHKRLNDALREIAPLVHERGIQVSPMEFIGLTQDELRPLLPVEEKYNGKKPKG